MIAAPTNQDANAICARDRHLFGPGRKRILSIDGGGVRGVVALAFVERFEALLAAKAGRAIRLCDYFDFIGGTSTGAIVATGLALGYSAAEIRDFYFRLAPRIFRKPFFRLPFWQAKFDAEALRREITGILGDRSLDSTGLQTGLGVMLKRIDAGGAWILTNNPRSKYWDAPSDGSFIGNRHYSLANIVRASTAAPHYFNPQEIPIVEGAPPALFVDGGLTPHNDPSLALLLATVMPCHRIGWSLGADKLTVVSVGTGSYRVRLNARDLRRGSSVTIALRALVQQISENQQLTLSLMSWMGAGGSRWPINSEIGDLVEAEPPFGAQFRFLRYDAKLEADWLDDTLGVSLTSREIARIRRFDDPGAIALLYDIGVRAANVQITKTDMDSA
jgi:hypothetical protein